MAKPGWYNAGYIFPKGYEAMIEYKSIINPVAKASYHCTITDQSGKPLFKVTSHELNETFSGKSPTACWKQVLDRINETLKDNGQPVVKTQVAGPEYFGLNDPTIVDSIEQLDPKQICQLYWKEKENILKARELYEVLHPRNEKKPKKKRRTNSDTVRAIQELDLNNEDSFRDSYTGVWSTIQRQERYLKRLENSGEKALYIEDENPLPDYSDPITLQPIVVPAVSPYGHVAGYYTWIQALKETDGICPFTKLPLSVESLIKLNKRNYHIYKDYIIEL